MEISKFTQDILHYRLSQWLELYYIFSLYEKKISQKDRQYLYPVHTEEPGLLLVEKNQTDFLSVFEKLPQIVCPLNELIKKEYLINS